MWCSSAVNRVWAALRAAAFTRASRSCKVIRLCVRPWPVSREWPSGSPLPSTRLVAFDGPTGTMSESDSRPQLEHRLWRCLVDIPRRGPAQRIRSGLSCSNACLLCVRWPRPRRSDELSHDEITCAVFAFREHARPPRTPPPRGSIPHTTQPQSALQTRRYLSARKTRSRPARCGFGRVGLSPPSNRQLGMTYSQRMV